MSAAFAVSTSQSRAGPTVSHRRRSSPAISPQVAVKLGYHGLQADPSRPAGRLPDPLLEAVYGLRGNPPLGVLARREAEPRKLVRKGRVTALFSLFTLSFSFFSRNRVRCRFYRSVPAGHQRFNPSHPSLDLSLIHISEPTRLGMISYAVFCL